jgi:membrane-bound lytic murein transglycosylase D
MIVILAFKYLISLVLTFAIMRKTIQWAILGVILSAVIFLGIYIGGKDFFHKQNTMNQGIDSVRVFYGNSFHTIYISDTLSFAGEPIPVDDSIVRKHLKYIIANNMNWFPRAYNELVQYPEVFYSIKQRLISLGVPPDFIYLAFNESHLENVTSTNGMCGIWQLEANTARRFGLNVNSVNDERLQIVKSTVAAANYLNYLHSLYGDWIIAAAAYNTGPGVINYNIQYLKVKNMNQFFQNYPMSDYVMHIVAFKIIFNYANSQLSNGIQTAANSR